MNITCAICGDLFTGLNPNETVYTTECGHLFHHNCLTEWLGRSKTCPQCRSKSSEKKIIRIFFNNATTTGNDDDPVLLKYEKDNLEFKLQMKEKEIKTINEEKRIAMKQNVGLRKEIKAMSTKVIISEQKLHGVEDELFSLKSYCNKLAQVKLENEELKKEVDSCKAIKIIINGTVDEAKSTVDNCDLDVKYLQECVKYFKERIKKLENEHRSTEREVLLYKKKITNLRKMLRNMEEKYQSKNNNSLNSTSNSIIQISDDDCMTYGNGVSDQNRNVVDYLGQEEERSHTITSDSENNPSKILRVSKPNPFLKSKTSTLHGLSQPKIGLYQQFQIPKLKSSSSASGDDVYHPVKYDNANVVKKRKKQLSSTAVSSVTSTSMNNFLKKSDSIIILP